MRAIVLETKGRLAAVLTDDGCVHHIPNQSYSVGQQIETRSAARQTRIAGWAAAAITAVAVGRDRVDAAQELGTTPGKLCLVDKLRVASVGDNVSYDKWLNRPVKDIMTAAKEQSIGLDGDWDELYDIDDDISDDIHDEDDKPKPNTKPDKNKDKDKSNNGNRHQERK